MRLADGDGYEVRRVPLERLLHVEMLEIFGRRPIMHGLLEVDVTDARRLIREAGERTGERPSLTAFLIGCLARAVDEDRSRCGTPRGDRCARSTTSSGARRPPARTSTCAGGRSGRMRRVPRPVRALLYRALARSPRAWKRYGGTVVLTSIGMFGRGAGWGISAPGGYPLSVIVGGIGERPALAEGRLEARGLLSLTVSFDHTVVDGADAARFVARLKELVEGCHGLRGPEPSV